MGGQDICALGLMKSCIDPPSTSLIYTTLIMLYDLFVCIQCVDDDINQSRHFSRKMASSE